MKIRNDRPVAVIVPSRHLAVDAGQTVPWPDDVELPHGFSVAPEEPTKAQLLEQARELGLDVDGRSSKKQIADAIAAHQAASHDDHLSPEDD